MNNKKQRIIEDHIERLISMRGWESFHTPAQLVPALSVECSELLDCCLWHTPEEINKMFLEHNDLVLSELADIAINYYSIIRFCGIDVEEIVKNKVDEIINRYSYLQKGEHR